MHFCFWVVAASNVYHLKLSRTRYALLFVGAALLWEVFERYAEKRWPDTWRFPESWWNAWVSDILMVPLACAVTWALFDRYWR